MTINKSFEINIEQSILNVLVGGKQCIDYHLNISDVLGALKKALEQNNKANSQPISSVILNLEGLTKLDSYGALLLLRLKDKIFKQTNLQVSFNVSHEYAHYFDMHLNIYENEVLKSDNHVKKRFLLSDFFLSPLAFLGNFVLTIANEMKQDIALMGRVFISIFALMFKNQYFSFKSLFFHIEQVCLRAFPIIALMSFLIGGIIAQQGIFQLRAFGADIFAINLVGVLILREMGVLLTSIMVAGRSGSAFTAEIGTMRMREEIDALTIMGADRDQILILPRIIALIISLPLLTILSDFTGLLGGMITLWIYSGVAPIIFLERLNDAIILSTFLSGLIKAPFMAFVIGVIGLSEGLKVKGSAESLGYHTTQSVVKAIFLVIVIDGLFAVFYGYINF